MQDPEISLKDFLSVADLLKKQEAIEACLEQGKSLQTVLQVPLDKIERIYQLGHRLLKERAYKDAANIFSYILVVQSFDARVWKSLGICRSLEGQQVKALECFATSALIENQNPENYLWMAACLWQAGDWEEAKKALSCADERASDTLHNFISEAQASVNKQDVESLQPIYHKQLYQRSESLSLEVADTLLSAEERQRALYVQIKHKTKRKLQEDKYPTALCEFYAHLQSEFEGNLVAFSLGFLAQGKKL